MMRCKEAFVRWHDRSKHRYSSWTLCLSLLFLTGATGLYAYSVAYVYYAPSLYAEDVPPFPPGLPAPMPPPVLSPSPSSPSPMSPPPAPPSPPPEPPRSPPPPPSPPAPPFPPPFPPFPPPPGPAGSHRFSLPLPTNACPYWFELLVIPLNGTWNTTVPPWTTFVSFNATHKMSCYTMLGDSPEFDFNQTSAAFTSFHCPDPDFQIVFRRAPPNNVDLFNGVPILRWETPSEFTLPPGPTGTGERYTKYKYWNQMRTSGTQQTGDIVACWQFFEPPYVRNDGTLGCRQNALHLVPLDYDFKNSSLPNLLPCITGGRFDYQKVPPRFVTDDPKVASGSPHRTCYTGVLDATANCIRSF